MRGELIICIWFLRFCCYVGTIKPTGSVQPIGATRPTGSVQPIGLTRPAGPVEPIGLTKLI